MEKNSFYETSNLKTVKDVILDTCERNKEKIAFVIKEQKETVTYINKTYKDLLKDITNFGASIIKKGIKNKRIAVLGRNQYNWVIAHLSNLLGGNVSVPLDKDLQYEELESSLIRSKADVIIFDEKYIDKINKIKESKTTKVKEFICMNEIENYENMDELIKKGSEEKEAIKEFKDSKIDPYEMAILLFTSGTTSQSKAVMLSQNNIASNIYSMRSAIKFKDGDINIAFLPFHHIFGSTCLIMMLASGVKTVFCDGLRYVQKNLKEYGVTVFVGVPVLIEAMYNNIMKQIDKQGKTGLIKFASKLSNILLKCKIDIRRKMFKQVIDGLGGKMRCIVSGGAPLDINVAKAFNSYGIRLIQGYGLTETSPVICAENDKYIRSGSVGYPMKDVALEIENKDENGIGEIRAKGPNIMLGYYENEEATNEVLKNEWFYTGDLGYFDKDGFLFITGRNKNLIVLKNGKKIFPEEIETLVNRLELIDECMVFGMPETNGDDVMLSVKAVYNEDIAKEKYPNADEEELHSIIWNQIKEINKGLPRYKYVKHLILTKDELIKTTTKKVKRNEEMKLILGK